MLKILPSHSHLLMSGLPLLNSFAINASDVGVVRTDISPKS
ncbi:hypothetical protein [Paenibacillus woosongensis]|nr:hypothetical protein [Paenibacillus woosongensis]